MPLVMLGQFVSRMMRNASTPVRAFSTAVRDVAPLNIKFCPPKNVNTTAVMTIENTPSAMRISTRLAPRLLPVNSSNIVDRDYFLFGPIGQGVGCWKYVWRKEAEPADEACFRGAGDGNRGFPVEYLIFRWV